MGKISLTIPTAVYLGNFGFAMIMSIGAGFYVPIFLGILLGVIPLIIFLRLAYKEETSDNNRQLVISN